MPIIKDTKMSLDFEFEFPLIDNKTIDPEVMKFPIRFHHTEQYGPTITFLDEDGAEAMHFPAIMFSEIGEHLVKCGAMESKISTPVPLARPQSMRQPVLAPIGSKIAMTSITKNTSKTVSPVVSKRSATIIEAAKDVETNDGDYEQQYMPPNLEDLADVDPVQSFMNDETSSEKEETPEEEDNVVRKPRPAPVVREKLSTDQIRQARNNGINENKRIKPLV